MSHRIRSSTRGIAVRLQSYSPVEPWTCLACRQWPASSRRRPRHTAKAPSYTATTRPVKLFTNRILPVEHTARYTTAPPRINEARARLANLLQSFARAHPTYISLPRLQLLLHGLQQRPAQETIRIALIAIRSRSSAVAKDTPADARTGVRRTYDTLKELVRLLLADPLKDGEAWEKELLAHEAARGRPLLVKVVADSETAEGKLYGKGMWDEVHVTTPLLHGRGGLEFLLLEETADILRRSDDRSTGGETDLLCPVVNIPTGRSGRPMTVPVPVHRTVLLGDGIRAVAELLGHRQTSVEESSSKGVTYVANLSAGPVDQRDLGDVLLADVSQGSAALQAFRHGTGEEHFGHAFHASNVPIIRDAITRGTSSMADGKKSLLYENITDLLDDIVRQVTRHQTSLQQTALPSSDSTARSTVLKEELLAWAERAHHELRLELELGQNSRTWRKLGWWKLFWRADDVEMILTEFLHRHLLPRAKEELIFMAGVLAGTKQMMAGMPWSSQQEELRGLRLPDVQGIAASGRSISSVPWPLHLHQTLRRLQLQTVPPLHLRSQHLILSTLGTSALSTALSALIYMSAATTGMYECGAIALAGTVFALRRLQRRWEDARTAWLLEVAEAGRRAIKDVEMEMGRGIRMERGEGRMEEEEEEDGEVGEARRVVERIEEMKEVLVAMGSGDGRAPGT